MRVMPNERPGVRLWVENTLPLPRCCPVSGNPAPGSRLTIRYRPRAYVLEVYALKAAVERFVGGHPDGTRNMETMLQKIAQDAADALGVKVRVVGELLLAPDQRMRIVCRARPRDVFFGDTRSELALPGNGAAVRLPTPPRGAEATAASDL